MIREQKLTKAKRTELEFFCRTVFLISLDLMVASFALDCWIASFAYTALKTSCAIFCAESFLIKFLT